MNELHLLVTCLIVLSIILVIQVIKYSSDYKTKKNMENIIYHIDSNIVDAGNQIIAHSEFNTACSKYTLICINLYLKGVMFQLSQKEDFENARAIQQIVQDIDKLINHQVK